MLISGEGGVGKTSLALRITGWALRADSRSVRQLPVLVEADLQEESLLSRMRSSLDGLTEQRVGGRGSRPPCRWCGRC